mmetsp:Transcript_18169/g.48773  ORF Transcript_18169/g.48773 Transcript_18169/m.48773 type:complete len:254 (-) Transcript_18169:397-1158(-)
MDPQGPTRSIQQHFQASRLRLVHSIFEQFLHHHWVSIAARKCNWKAHRVETRSVLQADTLKRDRWQQETSPGNDLVASVTLPDVNQKLLEQLHRFLTMTRLRVLVSEHIVTGCIGFIRSEIRSVPRNVPECPPDTSQDAVTDSPSCSCLLKQVLEPLPFTLSFGKIWLHSTRRYVSAQSNDSIGNRTCEDRERVAETATRAQPGTPCLLVQLCQISSCNTVFSRARCTAHAPENSMPHGVPRQPTQGLNDEKR